MNMIRLTIVLALLPTVALAQTRTYRDALGRETGRSVTSPNGTTYYDAMGHNVGRSFNQNGITTIYDQIGRERGKITSKPQGR